MKESVTYQDIIAQGRIEEKEKDIVSVLNARFKKIPKNIANKISAIHDLSILEELLKILKFARERAHLRI